MSDFGPVKIEFVVNEQYIEATKFTYIFTEEFQLKLYNFYIDKCEKRGCKNERGGLLVASKIINLKPEENLDASVEITVSNFIELPNIANPKHDKEKTEFFYERDKSLDEVWEEKLRVEGLHLIGTWHTHPNYYEVEPEPSDDDLKDSIQDPMQLHIVIGETYTKEPYPFYEIYAYQHGDYQKVSDY